jgi:hypothetical protein
MREIPSQKWRTFCERLNEFERGGVMTIEFLDRNGRQSEVARRIPFDEIDFGKRDACNDYIFIRGTANGQKTAHEIVEPISIVLRETEDGAGFNAMAIEAEEGTTFVVFQPVIRAEWLEGLAVK